MELSGHCSAGSQSTYRPPGRPSNTTRSSLRIRCLPHWLNILPDPCHTTSTSSLGRRTRQFQRTRLHHRRSRALRPHGDQQSPPGHESYTVPLALASNAHAESLLIVARSPKTAKRIHDWNTVNLENSLLQKRLRMRKRRIVKVKIALLLFPSVPPWIITAG